MSTPASTLNNTGVMLNSVDTSDNTGYSTYRSVTFPSSIELVMEIYRSVSEAGELGLNGKPFIFLRIK